MMRGKNNFSLYLLVLDRTNGQNIFNNIIFLNTVHKKVRILYSLSIQSLFFFSSKNKW